MHLVVELPLIKTFFLSYTEIFGQILPITNITQLDEISLNSQIKLTQIYKKRISSNQFKLFIGIPSSSQRWIILKLMHYYKAVNDKNAASCNVLLNNNLHLQMPKDVENYIVV